MGRIRMQLFQNQPQEIEFILFEKGHAQISFI